MKVPHWLEPDWGERFRSYLRKGGAQVETINDPNVIAQFTTGDNEPASSVVYHKKWNTLQFKGRGKEALKHFIDNRAWNAKYNPRCPYCSNRAKLVTGAELFPHAPKLADKEYWRCDLCDAHVGTVPNHPRHAALGGLAKKDLRQARMAAHTKFDGLWKKGGKRRKASYRWLAKKMDMPTTKCHIGSFDLEQCDKVIEICVQCGHELSGEEL